MTFFMRIGTWMLTSISPREWVAVHRKHHNFTDVEGDPHSPHIEGYWKIMLANVYYYRRGQTTTAPCRSMPPTFPTIVSTGCSSSAGRWGSP
jgi:fatty-acid desaturase